VDAEASASLGVEQRGEECRAVEAWQAEPVERAIPRDEAGPPAIADEGVVADGRVAGVPRGAVSCLHADAAIPGECQSLPCPGCRAPPVDDIPVLAIVAIQRAFLVPVARECRDSTMDGNGRVVMTSGSPGHAQGYPDACSLDARAASSRSNRRVRPNSLERWSTRRHSPARRPRAHGCVRCEPPRR
jgi:hypothetical protein